MEIKDFAKDIKKFAGKAYDAAGEAAKNVGEGIGTIAEKAADVAKETAKNVGEGVNDFAEKASDAAAEAAKNIKLAYYSPIFPEEYVSPDYDRPKMIVIEDEDDRKGVDVCEGAIGWFSKAAGLEVLHLYEEAVGFSGINFYPQQNCKTAFYRDILNPNRYINLECYYDTVAKDRITELKKIAYKLGAKSCKLESYEELKTSYNMKAGKAIEGKAAIPFGEGNPSLVPATAKADVHGGFGYASERKRSIVFEQTFEGNASPVYPELEWFRNDREIEFLIETRCGDEGSNKTKIYRVTLDQMSMRTLSVDLAAQLDAACGKLGIGKKLFLEGKATRESNTRFSYVIEF